MRTPLFIAIATLTLLSLEACREDAESPSAPSAELQPLTAGVTTTLVFRQVSVGGAHGCGVTAYGTAYCWGSNNYGELGTGTSGGESKFPVRVAGTFRFRSVTAGWFFTCGVTTLDGLYCWGNNEYGQLGNGTTTSSSRPVRVSTGIRIREASGGARHACAVSVGDIVYCWGRNEFGQLGDGTRTERHVPIRPWGWMHYSSVSAGNGFSCGVTVAHDILPGNKAYCWGEAGNGHYGNDGWHDNLLRPTSVPGGVIFDRVASGYTHVCGVTLLHRGYCWGANQRWLGSMPSSSEGDFRVTPRLVAGGHAFRAITAGTYWTCGVATDDVGWCWGDRSIGVGDGIPGGSWTPVRVAGGHRFREVGTGGQFACGLTTLGGVYCWGDFNYGPTPFLISGPA